jgi:PhnB protein
MNAIPDGYHSLTPHLFVDGGAAALEFYERAFGAEIVRRLVMGDRIMFAEVRVGDSLFTLADEIPEHGRAPDPEALVSSWITLYTEDVDAVYARAVEAGATAINEPADQFHGDRAGSLRDPFGHRWALATHTEDMSQEEMQRRMEDAFSQA